MNRLAAILRVGTAFAISAEGSALLFALITGDVQLTPAVLMVLGGIMLGLAVPAYLILRCFWRESWWTCILAGLFVGVAIVGSSLLLPNPDFFQAGDQIEVFDGAKTAAGWRNFIWTAAAAGGIGAGAGALFWVALRALEAWNPWPSRRHLPLAAGIVFAAVAAGTILWLPRLGAVRPCTHAACEGFPPAP